MKSDDFRWPEYVYRGFGGVYYAESYDDQDIEAFAKRWGGLDIPTFERIVQKGEGEDKVIAICAIGHANSPHVRALLTPLLQSPVRMERWTSAEALGRLHLKRALPALHASLHETLSPPGLPFDDDAIWDISARMSIASILGDWGQLSSIPVLRSALKTNWQWEQQHLASPPYDVEEAYVSPWQAYQYELAYALGQLGAFGSLTGIAFSDPRLRVLTIYMALGHLQARKHHHDLHIQMGKKMMQKKVAKVLEQRFGLAEAEQSTYIQRYSIDFFREGSMEREPSYIIIKEDEAH